MTPTQKGENHYKKWLSSVNGILFFSSWSCNEVRLRGFERRGGVQARQLWFHQPLLLLRGQLQRQSRGQKWFKSTSSCLSFDLDTVVPFLGEICIFLKFFIFGFNGFIF